MTLSRKDNKMEMIATCPDEIRPFLRQELLENGAVRIKESFRTIRFFCSEKTFYQLHLKLRCASRLILVVRNITAPSLRAIELQARKVAWPELIPADGSFAVEAIVADRGVKFLRSNEASRAVRIAIEERFDKSGLGVPQVDFKNPTVNIVIFVQSGRATISLDTTRKALHKRGFRAGSHPAPIKETLAAALLQAASYDGSENLYDPMCGSGTFAIEAAYIALRKAPLIHRKKGEFGFERMKILNPALWRQVQDEVRAERLEKPPAKIIMTDISAAYLREARENALRARVEKHIESSVADFFSANPPAPTGLMIMNIPYGERLIRSGEINDDGDRDEAFFRRIGDTLKKRYTGWRAAILVPKASKYKLIGLRPQRRIPVRNGDIECRLLLFDIYTGSKRA